MVNFFSIHNKYVSHAHIHTHIQTIWEWLIPGENSLWVNNTFQCNFIINPLIMQHDLSLETRLCSVYYSENNNIKILYWQTIYIIN